MLPDRREVVLGMTQLASPQVASLNAQLGQVAELSMLERRAWKRYCTAYVRTEQSSDTSRERMKEWLALVHRLEVALTTARANHRRLSDRLR